MAETEMDLKPLEAPAETIPVETTAVKQETVEVKTEPPMEVAEIPPTLPSAPEKPKAVVIHKTSRGRHRGPSSKLSVEEIVQSLTRDGGFFPRGVNTKELFAHTNTLPKDHRPNNSKNHLQVLLSRSVEKGRLVRLAPSLYTTTRNAEESPHIRALIKELKAEDEVRIAKGELPRCRNNEPSNIVVENLDLSAEPPSPAPSVNGDASRPQRKRRKKQMGPEFVAWAAKEKPLKRPTPSASAAPPPSPPSTPGEPMESPLGLSGVTCDACFLSASANPAGVPEPLLRCRDCPTRVHPSCLGYDPLLTARCRREPWQCADCKTCLYCATSEDSEHLLFCDFCDRAAHMGCLSPPLTEKPDGKWSCRDCFHKERTRTYNKRRYEKKKRLTTTIVLDSPPPPLDIRNGVSSPEAEDENREERSYLTLAALDAMPTCNCERGLLVALNFDERVVGNCEEAASWSVSDVTDYITGLGFPLEAMHFKEQAIDGEGLLLMSRADVLGPGLGLKLGPAVKIHRRVRALQEAAHRARAEHDDFV